MPTKIGPQNLPQPGTEEVHVWSVFLSEVTSQLPSLEQLLSDEEKQKAARFVRPEDCARYIGAHGILRQLLGRYLAVPPKSLAFVTSPSGKPALVSMPGEPKLSFNLAHSGDVIAYAVADNRRVGVDVEAIRSDLDVMELARGQFSPREVAALEATAQSERARAFFRCWTRKEAYVKARGEGLGVPLKQFSVSLGLDEAPAVQWAAEDPSASEWWSLFDLSPAPGYAGAVAVDGRGMRLVSRPSVPGG